MHYRSPRFRPPSGNLLIHPPIDCHGGPDPPPHNILRLYDHSILSLRAQRSNPFTTSTKCDKIASSYLLPMTVKCLHGGPQNKKNSTVSCEGSFNPNKNREGVTPCHSGEFRIETKKPQQFPARLSFNPDSNRDGHRPNSHPPRADSTSR